MGRLNPNEPVMHWLMDVKASNRLSDTTMGDGRGILSQDSNGAPLKYCNIWLVNYTVDSAAKLHK